MNGSPKNIIDEIDIAYHRYDFNVNEEVNKKIKMSNNIYKNKDSICDCIYKLNIFGNRYEIKSHK